MTDAVIFNSEGNNMLPADILYKQNIFAVRGSFRPVTLVNVDMFENGLKMFLKIIIQLLKIQRFYSKLPLPTYVQPVISTNVISWIG
jgi:hypothetical protein